jgi:flavin reductase (DIM6/NTAB) family NADH-FMN oxidoreductase RutF
VTSDQFVRVGAKDNFYQSSAFMPMSFALVTTVHENGETGIGPHALVYPFGITEPRSMLLISRSNSGTAANIRRTGKCALNYIEFDRDKLQGVANQGYPGMALVDKQKANPFALIRSPSPDKSDDPEFPLIVEEACQIFECTWDDAFDIDKQLGSTGDVYAAHFVLLLDNILIKQRYHEAIENGDGFPNMPIFYGFRAQGDFWFAEHAEPFSVPLPKVEGQEAQTVFYLANRFDEEVHFAREACDMLTEVPPPFLKQVLKGIIAAAKDHGVTEVDPAFMDQVNRERLEYTE